MRIAYICQYFVPEIGAPSARVSELSAAWAAQGHDVTVITGLPNHPTGIVPPEYRRTMFCRERLGKVVVWRNWLYATPNEGFLKKIVSHLSFMCSTAVLSTPRMKGFDVIVVSSPTFFVVITAWLMSRVWRIPYVFEVRDLWPGIFVGLGVLENRLIIRTLEAVELFLYRRAARVVVVTESFGENIRARGIPAARVVTITNGVDTRFFVPGERDNDRRREHGLRGRFVVLYIGAHGISHALSAILDAAELLDNEPEITFVFVGEGAEKAMLMKRAEALSLRHVIFVPGQPKDRMPSWYAAADVVLVPLRNVPLFETFIPSKMFEIMAAGRPIVGSIRGEARRILSESGGALLVDPEDSVGIAEAIKRLAGDPTLRELLGSSGRRFVAEHYDREALARTYLATLTEVVAGV